MNIKRILSIALLLGCAIGLTACNLPDQSAPPTLTEPPTQAIVLPTETSAPPSPTETDTPAPTATQTNTPEASATATIAIPVAEVVRETNCRTGPAGNYGLVAVIAPGTLVEIIASDLGAGYYWYIRNPENTDQGCWLLAQNMKVQGDVAGLPAFTPIPSPTQAPSIQIAFKNFDICKGEYFARFTVTNTGDVQFRSAYIKVTNSKGKEVVEQSLNAFDLSEGCIIAKNVAPLLPGQTGHLDSPRFRKDPRGQRLSVVIMACTEQNLKGVCTTQTLEVRP